MRGLLDRLRARLRHCRERRINRPGGGSSAWRWDPYAGGPLGRRVRAYRAAEDLGEELERSQLPSSAPQPARPTHSSRRSLALVGSASAAALLLALGVFVSLQGPAGAASLDRAAGAAEAAGSFAFTQTSELTLPSGVTQVTQEQGAVDLAKHAYRLRVLSESGVGFDRVVFRHRLFIRHLGLIGATPWREIKLAGEARVEPRATDSSGINDPLRLLGVLRQNPKARVLGSAIIEGHRATHFRLRTTLRSFLAAARIPAARTVPHTVVIIDAWLEQSTSRLLRAERRFLLPGRRNVGLVILSRLYGYEQNPRVQAPPTRFHFRVPLRLEPLAEDPLGNGLLGALLFHERSAGTAVKKRQRR